LVRLNYRRINGVVDMKKTILKDSAFRRLIKPSNEDSFYWYIAGLLDSKVYSSTDYIALCRYQSIGYKKRMKLRQGMGY
jgi:hypothetical protein